MDQPNKLWTPRDQFRQDVNHTIHLPDHSISPPINDILEAVSRLSLSQVRSLANHLNPSNTTSTTSTPVLPSLPVPSHYQTCTNRHTTKVLQILDQMDMEIAMCVTKLSGTPTINTLWEVKSLLNLLHPRLVKVTHRAPSIDMCKCEVTEWLVKLEALFTESPVCRFIPHRERHSPGGAIHIQDARVGFSYSNPSISCDGSARPINTTARLQPLPSIFSTFRHLRSAGIWSLLFTYGRVVHVSPNKVVLQTEPDGEYLTWFSSGINSVHIMSSSQRTTIMLWLLLTTAATFFTGLCNPINLLYFRNQFYELTVEHLTALLAKSCWRLWLVSITL